MRFIPTLLAVTATLAWIPGAHAQLPTGWQQRDNFYNKVQQGGPYPATPYYWGGYPGYYYANPYAPNYPAYNTMGLPPGGVLPAPVPVGGGLFSITRGGTQFNFWKAPSGYYYPWCAQPYPYPSTTVIYMQEGSQAPAQPPLSTMFGDMKRYIDDARGKGTISEGSYNHLLLRLGDLEKMERSAREEGSGALSPTDESDIRSKVNDLGLEISRSIKG